MARFSGTPVKKPRFGGDGAPAAEPGFFSRLGNYMTGTAHNFTDPEQWKDALYKGTHDTQGRSIVEQLKDPMAPVQAAADMSRTGTDFLTMGGYDAGLDILQGEQRNRALTEEARKRAGGAAVAQDLAIAAAAPSAASKIANPLLRAGGFGLEGAAFTGGSAVGHGERDPSKIAEETGKGALFGAAGSKIGDWVGGWLGKGKPEQPFKSDEALFEAADSTKKNTRIGKDLAARKERIEVARMANTQGQAGFKEMSAGVGKNLPRDQRELLSTIANKTPRGAGIEALGKAIGGGASPWAKIPLAYATKGFAPAIGTAVEATGALMKDVSPKDVEALKKLMRGTEPGSAVPASPETVAAVRDYLAKMMARKGPAATDGGS